MPAEDESFDWVVSFNTLEHIFDPRPTLTETFRVLKSGGTMVIAVPWMFRIHAHPDDYNRLTPQLVARSLSTDGFHFGQRFTAGLGAQLNGLFRFPDRG
ncbi:methyltransferase domain-containing protein [Jhaorihella thermophila]